jgi:hypothetical protein
MGRSSDQPSPLVSDEGAPPKRTYSVPELRHLGSVRELTLHGGSVQIADSFAIKTKVRP